ncbi:kelch repeat-containing protein [Rapidithrix thailandica]|uniref:Kelch repeat-containing protein n=1 Tax=Rapidithrix thailandica TaxID=413964 RepID=A0AAW9S688_9BACT
MKQKLLIWAMLPLMMLNACGEGDDETLEYGNWKELSDFEGVVRSGAVSFVMNGKAYVGTGFDGTDRLQDFWEYDHQKGYWTQKADFPGTARNEAVGFSVGNQGYIGLGYDGEEERGDFWKYDPGSNTWSSVVGFGGSARHGAFSFTLNGIAYVGAGFDGNDLRDFWKYDHENDHWIQVASVGGSKRVNPFAFVVDGRGYVGGGRHNGLYENDLWEYNPEDNTWTEKNKLNDEDTGDASLARENPVCFTLDGKVYVCTGYNGGYLADTWEYDPLLDTWTSMPDFEGVARSTAVGFVLDNQAFLATGNNGTSYRFDDLWKFDPTAIYDEED